MSLEMHASESSIYRNVQRLNKALSPYYKLHFSYKELAFCGQEEEIRTFYSNFFIEMSHATSRWPFSGLVEEEDVHQLIFHLAQDIRLARFPNHFKFVKYALAVALIRVQQGQEISGLDPQPFLHEVFKKMAGRPVVQEILEKYLPLTAEEPIEVLYQIFGSFITNGYLPFLTDPKGRDWARENYKVHYLFFKDLIADLAEKYDLTIDDPDELYYKLFIYMRFKVHNIDAAELFIDYTVNMVYRIRPYNPALYKDLYTRLDKHLTRYAPAFHNKLPYLIYNIYMLWPKLLSQLLVSRSPCRALVISQYDKNYSESLTNLLNTLNPKLLQVDTYDAYLVDLEAIKASSYELFITDFPLDDLAPDKMVLSFEQLPPPHQLQQLLLTVTNSILKKRQGAALRIGHKPEAVALFADRPENPLL
ncbi:MAG: helix-turn-helix domain-containing protein [Clostridiales bacterium]|nr:helix-turn-helix domain-containing protein [Clostridiales bacterium]